MPFAVTRPSALIRPPVRTLSIALLCVALGGCSPLESEYYWQREDDGAGFVLQYRLDLPRKEIRFVEIQLPAEAGSGTPKIKQISSIDDCQFSDLQNWNCEDRGYGDESIYMIKGDLHYNFFNEYRKYQLRNVLMARLEPCWRPAFAACGRAVRALFAGAQS